MSLQQIEEAPSHALWLEASATNAEAIVQARSAKLINPYATHDAVLT